MLFKADIRQNFTLEANFQKQKKLKTWNESLR